MDIRVPSEFDLQPLSPRRFPVNLHTHIPPRAHPSVWLRRASQTEQVSLHTYNPSIHERDRNVDNRVSAQAMSDP